MPLARQVLECVVRRLDLGSSAGLFAGERVFPVGRVCSQLGSLLAGQGAADLGIAPKAEP